MRPITKHEPASRRMLVCFLSAFAPSPLGTEWQTT